MTLTLVSVVLILGGLVPAAIARAKGRSFLLWWIYGAVLIVVALPHAMLAERARRDIGDNRAGGIRQCPACEGRLSERAVTCRQCGYTLGRDPASDFGFGRVAAEDDRVAGQAPSWDDGFARVSAMGPATPGRTRRRSSGAGRTPVVAAILIASAGALVFTAGTMREAPRPPSSGVVDADGQRERAKASIADSGPSTPLSPPPQSSSSATPETPAQPFLPPPPPESAPTARSSGTPAGPPATEKEPAPPEPAGIGAEEAEHALRAEDHSVLDRDDEPTAPVVLSPSRMEAEINPADDKPVTEPASDDEEPSPRAEEESQVVAPAKEHGPAAAKPRAERTMPDEDVQAVGEVVTWLQEALRKFGYYDGPINGRAGPQTQEAIRIYQRSRDMTPHGRINHALIVSLRRSLDEDAEQAKLPGDQGPRPPGNVDGG